MKVYSTCTLFLKVTIMFKEGFFKLYIMYDVKSDTAITWETSGKPVARDKQDLLLIHLVSFVEIWLSRNLFIYFVYLES